jgi:NADH-quinone oxidoreductase subunit L
VTAGVYMVTRMNAIFQLSPLAMGVVAVIGAATAIFAATMALVQNDIKKVLAYSTISQLGYMFLACGVGAFTAGIFHLMTHAFFKALLFLGAGSVIHAMGGEQDMLKMGGLSKHIRITWATKVLAALAIAGVPPLAGFFSKDDILGKTFEHSHGLWFIGWVTAGLTAFYMFRLVFLTFHGIERVHPDVKPHIHESPWTMTGPLVILAILSVVGGWIGTPEALGGNNRFEKFLQPVIAPRAETGIEAAAATNHSTEYALMAASILIALAGIWLAWEMYLKHVQWSHLLERRFHGLYELVFHKYYVDEIYDAMFVNRTKDLGIVLGEFDSRVIDGLGVDGAGWLARFTSNVSIWWDTWIVDGSVRLGSRIVWLFSYPVRMIQTGVLQNYMLMIVIGLVGFLGYYWFLYHR